jgi:radical SAM superfamily enzyme YgiQ (UPF0313 family)
MKIVLVYRGRYHVREALDLETLAPIFRRAGHQVQLLYDPDTFGVTDNVLQIPALARLLCNDQRTRDRIVTGQPDVILFSVLTTTYQWCRETAAAVRQQIAAPIVFFGLQPSLVPQHVMDHSCADFAIAGEVEGVILPLLERIGSGGDLSDVGNLWYRRQGAAVFTHRAPLVDLDALPLPDKDLFAPYSSHRYSYSAMVSRGCPYSCTFCEETCSKKLYSGQYFRRKQVETVMRELVAGKQRYRFREVIFKDSYLTGNKTWLRELMERYRREIGVPFKCFCTIHGFDDETAALLKQGGCYSIEFGLQTWNDRLRREILGRQETAEDAFRAFACCDQHRLHYDVDHMFHLPTETEQDHQLGVECYRRLRYLSRIKVHFLVYYPTADILNHAVAAGDLPSDMQQQLAEGQTSDFYDQSVGDRHTRQVVAGYAALYKILPLLPEWLVRRLSCAKRVRRLRWIPTPLMVLLQGLNALRSADRRFAAYLWMYPVKIFHTLMATQPKQDQAQGAEL